MNKFSRTFWQVAVAAVISTGFAMAQTQHVTIPFDFTVGKTMLPAGEYTIGTQLGSPVVLIRDAQANVHAMAMGNTIYETNPLVPSKLTFRVRGTKHFLASYWNAPLGTGREFAPTAAEREAQTASAQSSEVVLYARR